MPGKLAILGSTGSIGRQCLNVVDSLDGQFEVISMAAGSNVDLAAAQIASHHPKIVYGKSPYFSGGKVKRISPL